MPGNTKIKRTVKTNTTSSITIKMIAVECCKQKYFQGVSKTKGLSESITIKGLQGNITVQSTAGKCHKQKYFQLMSQSKGIQEVTIKTTAREGQIQNDDRECNNQKNCHGVSQSKELPGRMTNQSSTKEHHNQNGLRGVYQYKVLPETTKFEMTASEYHIKYYQIMTAGEGHFLKDCMGVSQLKEMPESITIKRSARENHN